MPPCLVRYQTEDYVRYRSEGKGYTAAKTRTACAICAELIARSDREALTTRMLNEWAGTTVQGKKDAIQYFHDAVSLATAIPGILEV